MPTYTLPDRNVYRGGEFFKAGEVFSLPSNVKPPLGALTYPEGLPARVVSFSEPETEPVIDPETDPETTRKKRTIK